MGLLQAKAYRALKQHTAQTLSGFNITTVEWALLGLLFDHPEGLPATEVANKLGVEGPFITQLVITLEKKKLVCRRADDRDKRVKRLYLENATKPLIGQIEGLLRKKTRKLLHGLSIRELLSYRHVLQTIVENYDGREIGDMEEYNP